MTRQISAIDRRSVIGRGLTVALTAVGGSAAAALVLRSRDGDDEPMQTSSTDVRTYGAKGDGVSDDAPAFQRAIDAVARTHGGTVTFGPGTYLLHYRPSEDGDGVSGITLRSGVTLRGTDRNKCILRVANMQLGPGTYARTIASHGEITQAMLRNFTIDGNRQGQGGFSDDLSGAAILLGWKGRCVGVTVEGVTIHDAVGQGIMLQGSIGNVSRDLRIAGNLVARAAFIGIQCSQFDGATITDNEVNDCHDNGIDIYGDDTIGKSTIATSHRAMITGNRISKCSIGVFLETVADCVAADNIVADCRTAGVRVNRIHGEPRNLMIKRNRIIGTPIGVAIGGDTGGVTVNGNDVSSFKTAGVDFSYNVSRVTVTDNRFQPATRTTPIFLGRPTILGSIPEEKLVHIRAKNNRIPRSHAPDRRFVNSYRQLLDVEIGSFIVE